MQSISNRNSPSSICRKFTPCFGFSGLGKCDAHIWRSLHFPEYWSSIAWKSMKYLDYLKLTRPLHNCAWKVAFLLSWFLWKGYGSQECLFEVESRFDRGRISSIQFSGFFVWYFRSPTIQWWLFLNMKRLLFVRHCEFEIHTNIHPPKITKHPLNYIKTPPHIGSMYGIFTYIYHKKSTIHVCKNASPIDPMGITSLALLELHHEPSLPCWCQDAEA